MEHAAFVARKFAPISNRMKVYEQVRGLVEAEGFSGVAELSKKLDASVRILPSRETLRRWALGKTSPFSGKRVFEARPSEELSFYLGAWIGDGWSDDNDGGKRMLLKVRSYDFAKEFASCASKILGKNDSYWVRRVVDRRGRWYLVKVTSSMLYDFVNQPFRKIRTLIESFPKGFLRGLFTAEGNPSVSIERTSGPHLHSGLAVANNDYRLLEFSWDLLSKLGYHPGRIRLNFSAGKRTNLAVARSSGWLLSLSRLEDARKFADEVGFADSAKQQKLVDAVSLIDELGTRGAAQQWTELYEKHHGDWVKKPLSSFHGNYGPNLK